MSKTESNQPNTSLLAQIASLNQTTKEFSSFIFAMVDSLPIIRWIGYGLLLLALFDVIEMFIPARFMNSNWEFQTFGALVERVAVPLIGFVLVFFAGLNESFSLINPLLNQESLSLKIFLFLAFSI